MDVLYRKQFEFDNWALHSLLLKQPISKANASDLLRLGNASF